MLGLDEDFILGLKLQSSAPSFEEFTVLNQKNIEEKKTQKNLKKAKASRKNDSSDENSDEFSDSDEEEEGQIAIPKDVIESID